MRAAAKGDILQNVTVQIDHDLSGRRALAELLFHLAQVINALGYSNGLKPAQWAALRYFAKVNPSARSLTEFANANAITKGAASQMISALVSRGLVTVDALSDDLRRRRIDLTDSGRALLAQDPLNQVADLLGGVDPTKRTATAELIETLVRAPLAPRLNNPKARQRLAKARQSRP